MVRVYDLAHSRAGDKGDTSNISVIAYDEAGWGILRDQLTEDVRCKSFGQDRVRWPIAFERPMGNQPFRGSLRFKLFSSFAECKRLSLGKHIRHQEVVMVPQRIKRLAKADEIAGDQFCSLMN